MERVEAVVQRQQRVPAEGDDDGLLFHRQHRGARLARTGRSVGRSVGDCVPAFPLRHRLGVDPVTLGEGSQALLTLLYRSTDDLRRGGAPVENLAHSASFHAGKKTAPSNPGIKHLADAGPVFDWRAGRDSARLATQRMGG